MLTRPEDLDDADLVEVLAGGWGIGVSAIGYAAVGFGSHHWRVTDDGGRRWFVTVDDLATPGHESGEADDRSRRRLTAALSSARALADAGATFVVAPRTTRAGSVVEPVGGRYAVALYEHVAGETHEFGPYPTRAERLAVLDLLATLHATPIATCPAALGDDLAIDRRDDLTAALANPDRSWGPGPFAEPARALLAGHGAAVARLLGRYDHLAATVRERDAATVLTHGEPHRGNTITTADGVVLIDWDTALLAPPERDLWSLAAEDTGMVDEYAARTGRMPNPDALELYQLRWDLTDIAIYVGDLRRPHHDTADNRTTWDNLRHHLDPDRWRGSA